jgi:hypothetical protein
VVFIDVTPDDEGEDWPRTAAGALARLRHCSEEGDKVRGDHMNLDWLYWFGEWQTAFSWLQENAPEVADQVVAEEEARLKDRDG